MLPILVVAGSGVGNRAGPHGVRSRSLESVTVPKTRPTNRQPSPTTPNHPQTKQRSRRSPNAALSPQTAARNPIGFKRTPPVRPYGPRVALRPEAFAQLRSPAAWLPLFSGSGPSRRLWLRVSRLTKDRSNTLRYFCASQHSGLSPSRKEGSRFETAIRGE